MLYLAGAAASGALDLISSLKQTIDSGKSRAGKTEAAFAWADAGPAGADASAATPPANPVSPGTLRAMLWLQARGTDMSPTIFSALDADGSGGVSQSEFARVFARNGDTARADRAFDTLDSDDDGVVSAAELAAGLASERTDAGAAVVTGADGATATTITYADGTTVTLSQPAGADTNAGLLEKLIQRQADMLLHEPQGRVLTATA